jgi:cobalt-zinc-cadmium efflux system membrane fusion protein
VEKSYLLAKSAYDSAKSNLDIVENSTIPDTIRQAEAQLTQARANYANNIITSPISGVVTARNINPGELASNNNSVVSLVNLDKVVVRVDVGENFINTMKDGSEVAVKVSAASEAAFKGTVTNIALAANPVTKAYPVKIEIPNPEHVLKPGMFAEVVLKGNSVEGIMVPREAVVKSGEKDAVWVVSEGAARKREVVAGASDGKNVIISSGLTVGEDVITSSQEALTDGGVVDIAKTGS